MNRKENKPHTQILNCTLSHMNTHASYMGSSQTGTWAAKHACDHSLVISASQIKTVRTVITAIVSALAPLGF